MLGMGKLHKTAPHVNSIPVKTQPTELPAPAHQPTVLKPAVAPAENLNVALLRSGGENLAAPRAVTESEALARDIKEGVLCGFVGAGTNLTGEAKFKGMLRIDGRLQGRINSDKGTLIVSAGGYVEADIAVAEAKINGTVHGDITATRRIEFGRNARVHGNILTPALVIENGAIFEGSCWMSTRVATTPVTPRPTEAQASVFSQFGQLLSPTTPATILQNKSVLEIIAE